MNATFDTIQRTSLSRAVSDSLMDFIKNGYFKVGDKLPPERTLCKEFGVSRTSLREGISVLVHLGILEAVPGSGVYVRNSSPEAAVKNTLESFEITEECISSLVEFREGIETFMGQLACEKATEEDVEKLEEIVKDMEKRARGGESLTEDDVAFHKQLALSCHNEFVSLVLESIIPFIAKWICAREAMVDSENVLSFHKDIVECIRKGDQKGVKSALENHFKHTKDVIRMVEDKE
jgi:GntR family transcriptional repressor for pyruvate dehydrogenase complex